MVLVLLLCLSAVARSAKTKVSMLDQGANSSMSFASSLLQTKYYVQANSSTHDYTTTTTRSSIDYDNDYDYDNYTTTTTRATPTNPHGRQSSSLNWMAGTNQEREPLDLHVPQKCLTRKSVASEYFSMGQSCCAATTQTAACLDGYRVYWSNRCCAFGGNIDGPFGGDGCAGPREFYCIPSKTDDNGALETGMPGTEHRRRWKYNAPGAAGETGSCCHVFWPGSGRCGLCKEQFTIQKGVAECGTGGGSWLCASQHR